MNVVYIGLGSNLGQPVAQLQQALSALAELPQSQLVCCSSFYGSRPMGPQNQPDYVNAVAEMHSSLEPIALLDALQGIEQQHGRLRKGERWGARTLDLDILLYGQHVIRSERLQVPHYGIAEREFVLYPLAEIAPDLVIPPAQPLQALLSQVSLNGLTKLTV